MDLAALRPNCNKPIFWWLFSGGLALYPLLALTTEKGYRLTPIFLLIVAIASFSFRKGSWSEHLKVWAVALVVLTAPYYTSYFISSSEPWTLERISYGWVFLAIGAAAVRYQPGFTLLFGTLIAGSLITLIVQLSYGGERASLMFNPIPYANVAAAFFCLLCVALLTYRRLWQVIAVLVGLVGWAAVVVVTETRGAMLAMIPGLAFLLWAGARRLGMRASAMIALVALICALGLEFWSGKQVTQRFQLAWAEWEHYQVHPEQTSSMAIRLELYRTALMLAHEHPFGLGEEGAKEKALVWIEQGRVQNYAAHSMEVAHFHSDWFQQLAVAGYLGVFCLLLFYLLVLGYFFYYRSHLAGQLGLVLMASFMISGLTDVPLYNRLTLFTLFLLVTFCFVGLGRKEKSDAR